ncbi:MAG: phosphate/phosphite/phosphonate ABC transporter substrate-binding protein [Magnetococcales bacterium]|nr:phosphate/phosphite/phosphonate ABC transporter substrate-binding protein [Magnetococcales bacterium]
MATFSFNRPIFLTVLAVWFWCVTGWAHAGEPLRFGVMPFLGSIEIVERFTPLVDLLEERLGQTVKLIIPAHFQQLIDDLGEKRLDMVYFGPVPYVRLVAKHGPQPIVAMEELGGQASYRGVVFVRQESPIQHLADLAGKRFVFGDQNSTMNHTVPRILLAQAGVTLERLAEHRFVGNNQNVVLAVLMGEADAAGVKEDIFAKYQARGLRVIAHSPPMPNLLYAAGSHLSAELVERLRVILTTLHQSPAGLALLKKIQPDTTALVATEDAAFDSLRAFLRHDPAASAR